MRIFINNRDLLTWPRRMANLLSQQGHDITIVDNASTYEPLLDYYAASPYEIIRLEDNFGPHGVHFHLSHQPALTEPYVMTDPDLGLDNVPEDWPEKLLWGLDRFPTLPKIGLSLDDTLIPPRNPAWELDDFKSHPEGNHPAQYGKATDGFYEFPTDTTFALYRPDAGMCIAGYRAPRPYTARHLPWHLVLDRHETDGAYQIVMDDEHYYYYTHADASSTTAGRLAQMLRRYKARKEGQDDSSDPSI